MEFTREELRIIFHALTLAEAYYSDEDRRVHGMHPPTVELAKQRLHELAPIVERITRYAKDLL